MSSRLARIAFAVSGLLLLAWLLTIVDGEALLREILSVGFIGFAVILAIYGGEFTLDVLSWQLTVKGLPTTVRWARRLFMARLAGEAYNVITPLGGMGGEPIKALILRRRYNVPYAASGASLVLAKTMNVLALLLFLAAGFMMMLHDQRISDELKLIAGAGLIGLTVGVVAFVIAQGLGLATRLASRLGSDRPGLLRLLAELEVFEQHLFGFYTTSPARFLAVLLLAFGNWVLGALGVWTTMYFIGSPVGFGDAWIIEAMAQMVRASTFFIPASIGAQEGTIMLVTAAITGQSGSGLALALLRRARELVWVAAGLAVSARLLGRLKHEHAQ